MTNIQFIKEYENLQKTIIKCEKKLEDYGNRAIILKSEISGIKMQIEEMTPKYREIIRMIDEQQEIDAYEFKDKSTENIFKKIYNKIQSIYYQLLN